MEIPGKAGKGRQTAISRTCRLKYMHVGKCAHCAGSIKHSLPVTSAKAGPSSPQNDSDWP